MFNAKFQIILVHWQINGNVVDVLDVVVDVAGYFQPWVVSIYINKQTINNVKHAKSNVFMNINGFTQGNELKVIYFCLSWQTLA